MKKFNILNNDISILDTFEISSDKIENIKVELCNAALEKYAVSELGITFDELQEMYDIIRFNSKIYYLPISVYLKSKNITVESKKIDLSEWWPSYDFEGFKQDTTIDSLYGEKYADDELIYVDYAKGYAVLYNRYTQNTREIRLDKINNDTKVSEDFNVGW